jgi:hypothetical protein
MSTHVSCKGRLILQSSFQASQARTIGPKASSMGAKVRLPLEYGSTKTESRSKSKNASAGNRTRGWPNHLRFADARMATANFTTKPPMLIYVENCAQSVYVARCNGELAGCDEVQQCRQCCVHKLWRVVLWTCCGVGVWC